MNQLYLLLVTTIAINLIFFLNLDRLNHFLNFYDYPEKKRKIHKIKTSLLGGSIFFVCLNIYFIFDYYYFKKFINFSYISIFLSITLIFIIGVIDDKKDIKAFIKSIFFILVILVFIFPNENLVIQNLRFSFLENEINLGNWSIYFTILCIFLFVNSFNMYDGINGQAGLYIITIFSYFFYKGILNEMSLSLIICAILFLYLNLKNKIFLGDNGSLLVSLLISIVVIKSYNENLIINCDEIFILMMMPGIDMARLFIERALKKKNPLTADGNHFHHILLKRFKLNYVLLINFTLISAPIIAYLIDINSPKIIISFLIIYLFMFIKLKTS